MNNVPDTEPKATVVYYGKGKEKKPTFAVSVYGTKRKLYEVIHLPTDSFIADAFYYLSTARSVCQGLLELGEAWLEVDRLTLVRKLPIYTQEYIEFYRFNEAKKAQGLNEWYGTTYQQLKREASLQYLASKQETEYAAKLHESDVSIGWLPTCSGGTPGYALDGVFRGRRNHRGLIHPLAEHQGLGNGSNSGGPDFTISELQAARARGAESLRIDSLTEGGEDSD